MVEFIVGFIIGFICSLVIWFLDRFVYGPRLKVFPDIEKRSDPIYDYNQARKNSGWYVTIRIANPAISKHVQNLEKVDLLYSNYAPSICVNMKLPVELKPSEGREGSMEVVDILNFFNQFRESRPSQPVVRFIASTKDRKTYKSRAFKIKLADWEQGSVKLKKVLSFR